MTEQSIASIAGIIVSLVFSYVPGLKEKYAALSATYKALIMLASLLLACGVLFGASCLGYNDALTCNVAGAKTLLPLFIAAAIANQTTYLLTPSK